MSTSTYFPTLIFYTSPEGKVQQVLVQPESELPGGEFIENWFEPSQRELVHDFLVEILEEKISLNQKLNLRWGETCQRGFFSGIALSGQLLIVGAASADETASRLSELLLQRADSREYLSLFIQKSANLSLEMERFRSASSISSDFAYLIHVKDPGKRSDSELNDPPAGEENLEVEWISGAFSQITGYGRRELARYWAGIVVPEDQDRLRERLQKLLGGLPSVEEFRLRARSGEVIWVRDSARPVWDAGHQQVEAILGAAQDITQRKRAEEETLAQARRQTAIAEFGLRALRAESIPALLAGAVELTAAMLPADQVGLFEKLSDGSFLLRAGSGWQPNDLQAPIPHTSAHFANAVLAAGQPLAFIDLNNEKRFLPSPTLLQHQVTSGFGVPLFAGRPYGLMCVFSSRLMVYSEAQISFLQALANILAAALEQQLARQALQDLAGDLEQRVKQRTRELEAEVTERQKAENDLRQKSLELSRSNTELRQFAYVVSHDLQEPLRMMGSFSQLLAKRYQGKLGADADEFIRYICEGAERMQRLIQDLLAYARIDSQAQEFAPVDCNRVFEQVRTSLAASIEAANGKVRAARLPTIWGDERQIGQLFHNLIENGLKFHRDIPPLIQVTAQNEGDHWLFQFKDNGIGIEGAYHERIFGIFQRLHSREQYPGNGIGLAICKKIIERHGGKIWVESTFDEGSRFYFTLPLSHNLPHQT